MAATTVPRTTALYAPHPSIKPLFKNSLISLPLAKQSYPKFHCSSISFAPTQFSHKILKRHRFGVCFASSGETTETQEVEEEIQDSQVEDNTDSTDVEDGETATEDEFTDAEEPVSAILASLQSYKEAVANNDEPKIAEIEALLKSIEDEKDALESKVATLSAEMSYERDRVLRISADFENFRKRTERERLSLVTNAKGEVVESLLPVLDNFERANTQIKVETEGEEKINNSYQSISKQFAEVLGSLGVVPVETTGNPFDPMLHEAIMREDSDDFEEGIILQEFRKGFLLGDRLLRPSMVKVSAGPGPAKSESVQPSEESEDVIEPKEEDSSGPAPTDSED
ncbi:GrpE protein-like [Heracleum sosnowskyi]|uniref:GrpE protein homolog n=1 Tax=Heracleum sosnowskyi TaxID=360622 RepID=A0AAD8NCB8_9APIA|nr:GrpE protein-like [Heracleum sosnowskyi]